jgi:adenosylmethionine-8-amino-7-oxononanoate aminotransferase
MALEDDDRRVLWHPFTQQAEWVPLVIARGEGVYLFDREGRRYIDGVSSLWCNVHGHCHPRLNRVLKEQVERLAHSTFLGLSHEPGIRLAEALVQVAPAPLSRVFYSDSGSTAVEVALKQSFQYWQLRGQSSKQRFLRLSEAYHGDTLGAVGVGGIDIFHRIFGPLLVRSVAIPSPAGADGAASLERLRAELRQRAHEFAALVMEPIVQGAAGMLIHPPGFLKQAAALCREYEVHLILDEVATGFGRTGRLFACEHEQVAPDFLCLAKGIAGGYLPLAATITTEAVYSQFLGRRGDMKHFFHGHTFTGNPLACAVGLESLALLLESTMDNAIRRAVDLELVLARIRRHPMVKEVRSRGLMVGIELHSKVDRFVAVEACDRARAHGAILRPLGEVVVWMPPLSISEEELGQLATATERALDDCS